MGIPHRDASKMPPIVARGSHEGGQVFARAAAGDCRFRNKIETIQSVLRHFLAENGCADLGKS
jgi:hypothetical protein